MKKRILAVLLALLCVITSCPLDAIAEEIKSQSSEVQCVAVEAHTHVNPEYADTFSMSEIVSVDYALDGPDTDQDETYGSLTAALKQMRKNMINRVETFTLYVKVNDSSVPSGMGSYDYAYQTLMGKVFNHTGDPKGGDYLNRHYGGCSAPGWYWNYSGYDHLQMNFTVTYYTTAAQEAAVDSAVDSILSSMNLTGRSDYDKIKSIYDYICSNVVYDHANLNIDSYKLKYTAYAALMNGTAVCQGYASLFYRMALESGLDARYIRGYSSGQNHGWNIVKIKDRYYNVDSTWDAGSWYYSYFLKNDANFTNHQRRDEYLTSDFYAKYPMTSSDFNTSATPLYISSVTTNVNVKNGETAKVQLNVSGTGLQYQWYFKNAGASSYSKSSTTTNTYSTTMNTERMNRKVYCIVTDAYNNSLRSETYTLKMKPTITYQPKTTYTKSGAKTKTVIKAVGDGLTYTWYFRNADAATFSKSSITTNTYTTTMDSTRKDRQIYCVVKDKYGNSVKSNIVRLRMAATITTQPKNKYTRLGATSSTSVKAVGDGLTYQWYYTTDGTSSTFHKSSNKTATYSTTMDLTRKDRQVYCVVTDKYGKSVKSNVVNLRLAASITTQPKTVSAYSGSKIKTSVKAVGDGLTYTWYYKNAGASSFTKSTITSSTYSTTMDSTRKNRQVYCVVKDKYGSKIQSNTVTLKMK